MREIVPKLIIRQELLFVAAPCRGQAREHEGMPVAELEFTEEVTIDLDYFDMIA